MVPGLVLQLGECGEGRIQMKQDGGNDDPVSFQDQASLPWVLSDTELLGYGVVWNLASLLLKGVWAWVSSGPAVSIL